MELYISLIVVWLVIFVVSVIIEACTTELVSIWFSAGSIIALILSAIPNVPFYIPIIVFIVISLTLLLCLRPIIKKMLNKNTLNSIHVSVTEGLFKTENGLNSCEYDEWFEFN